MKTEKNKDSNINLNGDKKRLIEGYQPTEKGNVKELFEGLIKGYKPIISMLNEIPPSGGSGVPSINSTNNNEKLEDSNNK